MPATLIFENGTVLLPGTGLCPATVAVRAGRITDIATDPAHAARLRESGDQVIDLTGRSLLPGFYDAHVHPVLGCVELSACNLRELSTYAGYLEAIGRYARDLPEDQWVQGGGWDHTVLADRDILTDLDRAVPDRPVFLASIDHHAFWANSLALAAAGVSTETPDPPGGHIERDESGRLTGILHETAVDLVRPCAPAATEDDFAAALARAQSLLHSLGIVGWQDAMIHADAHTHLAYRRADAEGWLTAHVSGALLWDADRDWAEMDEQIAEFAALREESRSSGDRYRIDAVKIMCDGVAETHTASLIEPYFDTHGCPGTDHGLRLVPPDRLRMLAERLCQEGFQIHFHALGDRAVRDALDAIEHAVATTGRTDLRHQLAHLQFVAAEDVPRFSRLPATANLQALWAAHEPDDPSPDPRIGEQRTAAQYPFADLARAGAAFAMGSDWPVSTPNPFPALQVAATRLAPGAPVGTPPLDESQRLPVSLTLEAYTRGSAHACHADDDGGVIAIGRRADLVVVDRDLGEVPDAEVGRTTVLATYIGGVRVHGDGS